MKTFGVRMGMAVLSLLSLGGFGTESHAAGPASAQLAVTQIQSTLTEASVGWHRWGRRCCGYGYGYGGWGYGGGWGGYYGGYRGYYGGYSYARPAIYTNPGYYYSSYSTPTYYSGYSYSPYQSACGCGYSASSYQPVYSVSSYSYPSQPAVYGSVYSTPTVYGASTYGYGTPTYTPSTTSPSVISSPSTVYPSTNTYTAPVSAPYPAPPVEYSQPSAKRSPVAQQPQQTASSLANPTTVPARVVTPMTNTPMYSPTFAYTGYSPHAAYLPVAYRYSTDTGTNNLLSYRNPW